MFNVSYSATHTLIEELPSTVESDFINSQIEEILFYTFPNSKTTVCLITLKNKFEIIGTFSCVDGELFNVELGEKYAQEDAEKQIYGYYAFLLTDIRHNNP